MRKADRKALEEQNSQVLTISIDGERLAIPVDDVIEVIRSPSVTRVPLSPPGLLGLANLRGAVIPIVSLPAMLGRASSSRLSRVVVVGAGSPVGLAVGDVSSLEQSDRLRSGAEPVPFVNAEALLAAYFGTAPKLSIAAETFVKPDDQPELTSASTEAFLSFGVAGQEFALPLASVNEVLALPAARAVVPRTDDAMLGAVTLRNRLLPLLSLATLLGLGAPASKIAARIVVASINGTRVGLVVDTLNAIVRAAPDQIDPVPLVLTRGRQEAHIQAICRLDEGRRLMSVLSTDHLLEGGLAERLAAESDNEDEVMADVRSLAKTEQFVIFQLGSEHFGLPIGSVSEVVTAPDKLTKLPKAPSFVDGVMNLRGQVVPVIDQRRRFETKSAGPDRKSRIIIVRIGKSLAGFVVDGVSEVLSVSVDQLRASPQLTSTQSKVIDRIANLEQDGRMILLINPQELLDRAERDMVAAMHRNASADS